jgi:hypothetical protein
LLNSFNFKFLVKCSLLISALLVLGFSIATSAPVNSSEDTVELQAMSLPTHSSILPAKRARKLRS